VLDLHGGDLDAPGVGVLVDDLLELLVDLVAGRQQVVQLLLAENAPSVVWAIWEVANMKSSTATIALVASITRK